MIDFARNAHYLTLALYCLGLLLSLIALKAPTARAWAVRSTGLGLAVSVALLLVRWRYAGFLPVTGLFSALHFLVIWMIGATLYFTWRYYAAPLLPGALLLALLALLKAGDGDMALAPLTPALDTPLFFLHVAPSFAAYGLFGVAAIISAYRLIGATGSDWGHERRMVDEATYIGYIFLSWCMIAGSLWAYLAWGSYFTWRVKGLWTTLLWFYYSGVIHVRNRGRWQGWPIDLLSIVGFGLVLFTFLGLSLIFNENSHPLR